MDQISISGVMPVLVTATGVIVALLAFLLVMYLNKSGLGSD